MVNPDGQPPTPRTRAGRPDREPSRREVPRRERRDAPRAGLPRWEPPRWEPPRWEPTLRETVPPDAIREPRPDTARPRLTDDPIGDPVSSVSVWNIANALTVLRLLLVPVFVVALFWDGGHNSTWRVIAWAVFAVAAVTDRIDGEIARKRHIVTDFGKLADPIADKALAGAALIGLSLLGDMPWLITVVMLGREVGVTMLRFWVIRHGVIPASRGGKVKTLLQGVAVGLYVLPLSGWLHVVATVILYAAVVMALVTGVDYVARALRLRRGSGASATSQITSKAV